LRHPNVVELVASGKDERGLYLALELVRGPPLSVLLKSKKTLPIDVALYIARSVAAGLAAAHALVGSDGHALGIVHRDVTPSNVLLSLDGNVKITDFGVAKANRYLARTRTTTGVLKGKVPYMSPEYALAKPVDARSDLYSLGVVIYEMLAGHRPFDSESDVALLKKIAEEPAPALSELGIAPDVSHIVERLLQKRPEDRVEDAEALCFELDTVLAQRGRSHAELQRELAKLVQKARGSYVQHLDGLVKLLESGENPEPTAIIHTPGVGDKTEPATRAQPLESRAPPSPPSSPAKKTPALAIGVGVGGVLGLFLLGIVVTSALTPSVETPLESVGPVVVPPIQRTISLPPTTPPPPVSAVASEKPSKPARPPVRPKRPCTKDNPDYPMCLKR
jgi:serine/threonine protein kinase